MLAGGFAAARAEHLGPFWRVCGELPDKNEHSGTTAHQVDPQDPRALARTLVALAAKPVEFEEIAEAPETVEPTFAPGEDPLDVPPEPEHDSAHEGDGETGEEADGAVQVLDADSVSEDGAGDNPLGEWFDYETTGDAGGGGGDVPLDADFADFADLPELGQELAEEHPEEAPPPQDRFFGLDDLDRRRSLRIGDVVRISRAKQAEIAALMSGHDFAAIQSSVVRDTKDGRYIGPQATYDLFVELSRHQSAINRVKAAEADKVAFLEAATRPDLEAFDPEAGWPE